jgi:hypothetical protein
MEALTVGLFATIFQNEIKDYIINPISSLCFNQMIVSIEENKKLANCIF